MAQPEVIGTKTIMRDGKSYTVRVYASQSRVLNPTMRGVNPHNTTHGAAGLQAMYAELEQLRLAVAEAEKRA